MPDVLLIKRNREIHFFLLPIIFVGVIALGEANTPVNIGTTSSGSPTPVSKESELFRKLFYCAHQPDVYFRDLAFSEPFIINSERDSGSATLGRILSSPSGRANLGDDHFSNMIFFDKNGDSQDGGQGFYVFFKDKAYYGQLTHPVKEQPEIENNSPYVVKEYVLQVEHPTKKHEGKPLLSSRAWAKISVPVDSNNKPIPGGDIKESWKKYARGSRSVPCPKVSLSPVAPAEGLELLRKKVILTLNKSMKYRQESLERAVNKARSEKEAKGLTPSELEKHQKNISLEAYQLMTLYKAMDSCKLRTADPDIVSTTENLKSDIRRVIQWVQKNDVTNAESWRPHRTRRARTNSERPSLSSEAVHAD